MRLDPNKTPYLILPLLVLGAAASIFLSFRLWDGSFDDVEFVVSMILSVIMSALCILYVAVMARHARTLSNAGTFLRVASKKEPEHRPPRGKMPPSYGRGDGGR